ncbi:two-component regulator propeller domain-containing protein [uncultured Lutibacter sp.]|uniref:type IX secretion system anionic LPS delivery protein PorZ n=1 Tax=uncultured Lutibacter sp. TaxID=437739 RepID=UPI00260901DC|nr:two-component regulator propeller domain-containing protein [uncultured Lutibacter sp.]
MKKFTQIFIVLFINITFSQVDYSNNWEDFYSYNNVKNFIKVDNEIYAIVDNAIFTFNVNTSEITKISSVNGLSGETTTSLFYSKTFDKVIIGYETGLLEIIDSNNNITIAKDIVNFNYSGNKQINNITEYNNKLYLSTSFAVIVYDIDNLQFGDTYFIGNQSSEIVINQIKINQNIIYAATEDGIFTADVTNRNLIDFNNWTQHFSGNFSALEVFNNNVFASNNRALYTIENNTLLLQKNYPTAIRNLKSSEENLIISTQRSVYVNDAANFEILNYTTSLTDTYYFDLNTAYYEDNKLYLGTKEFGILKSNIENISTFEEIHPEGPVSNLPFSIGVNNNNLWVVYGGYDSAYTPQGKRFGYSHFNGTNWINTPYNSEFGVKDLVNITFDPNNNNIVYLSSWGSGMLIVEDDVLTTYWNHLNSGLEKLDYQPNPNYVSIRINGSAFDTQGNLWISNAWVDDRIKKYSADGTWSSFDMSSVITNPAFGLNELIIDKTNNIWIGSRRNGVLVFNENGANKKSLTTELMRGSLPDLNVRTVKADSNNRIWIGTKKGLVVFYNAANVFNSTINDAEPIIILDDGIAKKLLGEQPVNSIAIDGADNKWFGTETGGVLQTNPSGTTTLKNFNTDNSPLPSNNILKIGVDTNSGKVYFATDKGIVAFNSNVSLYGDTLPEVYAYPNPSTKNNEFITIDGRNGSHIPNGTNVKILDAAGNLVYETNTKEGQEIFGGKVVWNKTNLSGNKVASGIYIVLLITKDHLETTIAKIAIIN